MTVGEIAIYERVKSVPDFLTKLSSLADLKVRGAHFRYWFRGQPTAGFLPQPGVYRPPFYRAQSKPGDEINRLRKEQSMIQDFRIASAGVRGDNQSDVEFYFLAQHYGMPTRLLDWTTDALAALYFAVSRDPSQHADVFFVDAKAFETTQDMTAEKPPFRFWGIADSRHPTLKACVEAILHFKAEDAFPRYVFPVRPDQKERRITLQRGCFTFHTPLSPAVNERANASLKRFLVEENCKGPIQDDLARLGLDEFAVYGDLNSLSKTLISNYADT